MGATPFEMVALDGGEANRLDAGGKMRYKPLASRSWRPSRHVGDVPLRAQWPHAEYVNVANAAHMVAGDRNDIFAESVIEFLKRVVPPR